MSEYLALCKTESSSFNTLAATNTLNYFNKKVYHCPGWCGSGGWVSSQKQKGQDTCWGCGPGRSPSWVLLSHIDVSLLLFLPPFSSL